MRRWLLLALAILLPGAAHATCPPVPYIFANGTVIDANKANADWAALRTCINNISAAGYPHVAGNTELQAASTLTFPDGVWRDDFAPGFGAPAQFFQAGTAACSLNSGSGDNGSQVRSANGKCWLGYFDAAGADVRQWGAASNGADQTSVVQAAINATATISPLSIPAALSGFTIGSSTILMPNGTSIRGSGPVSYFKALPGASSALFRAVPGATVITLQDFEIDGNSANGGTGNCIDTDETRGVVDFTALNMRVHDCGLAGLTLNGSTTPSTRFDITGGEYYNNGRNADSTHSGAGIELTYANYGRVRGVYAHDNAWAGVDSYGSIQHVAITGNVFNTNGGADAPITGSCGAANQDSITFYNADSSHVTVADNVIQNSCNGGIHGGGRYVTYANNVVDSPVFQGIVHRSRQVYTTGTASCDGTTTITGNGTSWLNVLPYNGFYARGNGGQIAIGGVSYEVLLVNSDTSITTTGTTCPAVSGAPYVLSGFVTSHDVAITGNTISNAGLHVIWLDQVVGGSVTGNASFSGGDALLVKAGQNVTVSGNAMRDKPTGVLIDAEAFSNTGTVTLVNGDPGVVGSGTSFLRDATQGTTFQVVGDTTNYLVQSVTSDTVMTLSTNFTGTGGAGQNYGLAIGPSVGVVVNGNSIGFNTTGLSLQASSNGVITGNSLDHNTTAIDGLATTGNVEFGDFINGNNFVGSATKMNVEPANQRIGTNTDGIRILTGIAPTNCTGQLAGAIYNNAGTPDVCP